MGARALRVSKELAFSWEAKVVRFLGVSPHVAAPIVAALVAATYFIPGFAMGLLPIPLDLRDSTIPIDPYSWAAIVTSLLAGFTVFALPYAQTRHQADIVNLAPVVPSLDRAGLRDLYVRTAVGNARSRFITTGVGWLLGFLIPVFAVPGAWTLMTGRPDIWQSALPPEAYWAAGWFLVIVPFLIGSLSKASHQMISSARRLLSELESRLDVSPLESEVLRPLANAGLHTSFIWMIGAAIGMLFVLDSNIESTVIVVFMAGIALLGGLAAIGPAMAGRRVIRRAKEKALADVRAAIARLHLEALDPSSETLVKKADDQRLAQMGALLAYEDRLEKAPELPITAPTVAQFALYLAIPVGSWLGGAFVERMVDAALG